MADPRVQHESVLLPGYWRIINFGRLTTNPLYGTLDQRIRVYLAQLKSSPEASLVKGELTGEVRQMLLPPGELARLHLNTVLLDGRFASRELGPFEFESRMTRAVDCSRQNIRVIDRNDRDNKGEYIIPVRQSWEPQTKDFEQQGLFVAIGDENDPYATLIPAIEVFRFFYATSDVITKSLLKDHFLDPYTHIWNPDKSALSSSGHAVLWLRKQMLDADARFIARFAFDKYALKQAQDIFLFAAKADPQHDRMIRALPPFEGLCSFTFIAVKLEDTFPGRVLVTRLKRCSWAPPFLNLAWDRDNGRRLQPGHGDERSLANGPTLFVPPQNEEESLIRLANAAPSVLSFPLRLQEEEITERFPELIKVPAKKLLPANAEARAKQRNWQPIMLEAFEGSVVDGRSSTDIVGQAIIQGLEEAPKKITQEVDDVDESVGDTAYLYVLQVLKNMNEEKNAQVDFLGVLDDIKSMQGVTFNVYPPELNAKRKAWLYVDATKTLRRMVLLAEVRRGRRVRYVIELQQRKSKGCSTIVFWSPQEDTIPPGVLAFMLMDCARTESTTLVNARRFDLRWTRLIHKPSTSTWSFMARIFE